MKFQRRNFLAAFGASAAFLPILEAERLEAVTLGTAKRLILMAWPNGVIPEYFWPKGGWPTADATSFTIDTSEQSVLKPLIPHQQDILIAGGLRYENQTAGQGHASMPMMFTGVEGASIDGTISDGVPLSAGGPSVDMYVADHIASTSPLAFHSLQLQALKHNGNDRFCSFRGTTIGGLPNAPEPEADPTKLFAKLFGVGQFADPASLERIRLERKSVFDYVGRNLESLGSRMGTDDKAKIQAHIQAIRDVEGQLAGLVASCTKPDAPDPAQDYLNAAYTPLIPTIHKLQADMVVAAMACDLTRVASLLWADSSNGGYSFFWLGSDFVTGRDADNAGSGGPLRQHHEIAHHAHESPENLRRKNLVDQWFFSQFAYILEKLKAVKEGSGTMLDNSAVLCANVFAEGGSHSTSDLPWVLGGSLGGYFKTSRYLRYTGGKAGEQASHVGLLKALANGMGASGDAFGDPKFGGEHASLRG